MTAIDDKNKGVGGSRINIVSVRQKCNYGKKILDSNLKLLNLNL